MLEGRFCYLSDWATQAINRNIYKYQSSIYLPKMSNYCFNLVLIFNKKKVKVQMSKLYVIQKEDLKKGCCVKSGSLFYLTFLLFSTGLTNLKSL